VGIALPRGYEVSLRITQNNQEKFCTDPLFLERVLATVLSGDATTLGYPESSEWPGRSGDAVANSEIPEYARKYLAEIVSS
jgi:hypothetical protein